jgi:hypothetical protein
MTSPIVSDVSTPLEADEDPIAPERDLHHQGFASMAFSLHLHVRKLSIAKSADPSSHIPRCSSTFDLPDAKVLRVVFDLEHQDPRAPEHAQIALTQLIACTACSELRLGCI